jgi:hypothetical protein
MFRCCCGPEAAFCTLKDGVFCPRNVRIASRMALSNLAWHQATLSRTDLLLANHL